MKTYLPASKCTSNALYKCWAYIVRIIKYQMSIVWWIVISKKEVVVVMEGVLHWRIVSKLIYYISSNLKQIKQYLPHSFKMEYVIWFSGAAKTDAKAFPYFLQNPHCCCFQRAKHTGFSEVKNWYKSITVFPHYFACLWPILIS